MRHLSFGFLSLLLAAFVFATETPTFRLQDISDSSDVIAIANITGQSRTTDTTMTVGKTKYHVKNYSADATIEKWIKGQSAFHISIGYSVPEGFLGYATISFGRQLVFLRHVQTGFGIRTRGFQAEYEFTSPYYPSFPVVSPVEEKAVPDPAGVNEKILKEFGLVLASEHATPAQKSQILENADELPPDKNFDGLLHQGLSTSPNADARLAIISVLISRNDVSVLPQAQQLLTGGTLTEKQKHRLGYQLGALRDPQAAPILVTLLQSEDEVTRRGSAEALWHIADRSTAPALVNALSDPMREIRYYATRGLADITGDHEWGPERPQFNEDESRILQHWKDWAAQTESRPTH